MKLVDINLDSAGTGTALELVKPSAKLTPQAEGVGLIRCPANLRAIEEIGEIDRVHALGWRGPIDTWLDLYHWEPGNSTRYALAYGKIYHPDRSIYLIGWTESRRGDPFFTFSEPQYLHHYYIEQALGINQADAVGILEFLARMGPGVGYPTEGTW